MEAAIIKVSSKGQIVIPSSWRKRMNIKEGEELLAVGEGDVLMLKKIEGSSLRDEFYNTVGPLRRKVKKLGLTKDDLIEAIDEARANK
ncbi:MAG: AbrB/MazE/SpoVT family DNA-binding domain-containing protein [Thermoplasmata archaeon]|nr:AbrB/MazE/SpoVT family DNA-binding domain-containing protein [Thermoplasmata archaeon]